MSGSLWNKFKYKSPIDCLVDKNIRSYDITKANISVLRDLNRISEETYQSLLIAPKIDREVFIGKLIGSDSSISKALADGIIQMKKIFFETNSIEDHDVLEIDNDSVYIIGNQSIVNQQVSDHVYFRLDEVYTSFYKVNNIRYFYYGNIITREERLRAKGLGEKATAQHDPYMLDFLKELFYTAQFVGIQEAISLLSNVYAQYISKNLPNGFYRNLDNMSMFSIINFDNYARFYTDNEFITGFRDIVDISYNEKILREFNKLLSNIYFFQK